jgi:exosortase
VPGKDFAELIWNSGEVAQLRLRRLVFAVLVGASLIASYLPVFSLYARQHWTALDLQGAYAHAPLALLIIAFLFWRQRHSLMEPLRPQLNPDGLLLLASGVSLKIYGDVQGYIVLQGMSIIPVILGLLWSYYFASTVRALRFPVLFLFFVIPLPAGAIDALTMPLLELTSEWVSGVLPLFNIDVEKTGHVLTVNAQGLTNYHEIILAPECSGIRSFISLLALSCLFAHLQGRSLGQSIVLMLVTIPLVAIGNCIRVVLTVLMIVNISPEAAQNYFHWFSGLLLFMITLAGLFAIDALLMKIPRIKGAVQ